MAFPVIATQANGAQTSNSTSWTLTYPSGIAAGDLLLIIVGSDGTNTGYSASGFTLIDDQPDGDSAANNIAILGKVAAGTESGNFTLTNPGSEQGIWQVLRITGWYGGTIPSGSSPPVDGDGIAVYILAAAASSPNTAITVGGSLGGAFNPANWDVEDTLWIACGAWDGTPTATAKDANYTYVTNSPATSGGAGGAGLAVSWRNNAVASENPGDYTISASENWVSAFIAVRPAAPAAPRVPYFTPYPQLLPH